MKKKTILKRLLVLALSGSMLASVLTGCGSNESNNNDVEQSTSTEQSSQAAESQSEAIGESKSEEIFDPKSYTEGVTITIATPTNARIESFDQNELTYMVEEALGVNIEFVNYPGEDYQNKLNLMMSTGEKLPDIIFKADNAMISGWAAEGMLLELSKFYEDPNFSPNITAASEETGVDVASYISNADGEIYGLPRWEESKGAQVFKKLWVYKPWLDALGLDVPETAQEFYEACELVTKTDLNGNGKQDEVAIWGAGWTGNYSGWFGGLMSPYIYAYDDNYLVVEDGQVSFAFTRDEYKEGMKYVKSFVDIGAFPTEIITQNVESHDAQMYTEIPSVFAFWGYNYTGTNEEIEYGYVPITGLTNADGENGYSHYQVSKPTVNSCITADCENPEAAFLVADYFCNEHVSLCGRFGIQGVHWDYYKNLKDVLPDWENYKNSKGEAPYIITNLNVILDPESEDQWNSKEPQHHNYRQAGPFIRVGKATDTGSNSADKTERKLEILKRRSEAIEACIANKPAEIYDHGPLTANEMEKTADISATLISYVREMYSLFITGEYDIDQYWDEYLAELKKIGVDVMLETYQTAYDRQH